MMRVEKRAIDAPDRRVRRVRFDLKALRAAANKEYHLRVQGEALLRGEGGSPIYSLNGSTARIYCASDVIFAYDSHYDVLYDLKNDYSFSGYGEPQAIVGARNIENAGEYYVVYRTAIRKLYGETCTKVANFGGHFAAQHGERMFVANKNFLYYSAPLKWANWGSGNNFELPAAGGYIVSMVAFRDKLYLFREHGEVTRFSMLGEEFNAKAVSLPCPGGAIARGSAVVCGDKMYYLAEQGLYSFDGSSFRAVEHELAPAADLAPFRTASVGGKYYAVGDDDPSFLYCYDPVRGEARLLHLKGTDIAACDGKLFYLYSGKVWQMTEDGECIAEEGSISGEHLDFGTPDREKFIDGILFEGASMLRVGVSAEDGPAELDTKATCGQILPTPGLRGKSFSFAFGIPIGVELRAVTFFIREEGK